MHLKVRELLEIPISDLPLFAAGITVAKSMNYDSDPTTLEMHV
jgi:hypothetical protein